MLKIKLLFKITDKEVKGKIREQENVVEIVGEMKA